MKVLLTGNTGYIGGRVVKRLREAHSGISIDGMDLGFFAHCLTNVTVLPEVYVQRQLFADVRKISPEQLRGYDAVIHLAAISNDPMGKTFEEVTAAINHRASVALARAAKEAGVRNYVFASSCSVYGAGGDGARTESSELNPLTAYAKSKINTENDIKTLAARNFNITCLRFSTACGMSERLRLDLVLNDFVAGAVSERKISILSDGTPWRPLIHVDDMARAMDWAMMRTGEQGGDFLVVNVGSDEWNYQVRELADAVAKAIPGTQVSLNPDAPPDKRSYRVDFSQYRKLAPKHQPQVSLNQAVAGLKQGLEAMNFRDTNFRQSTLIRLKVLAEHLERGRLNAALEWN